MVESELNRLDFLQPPAPVVGVPRFRRDDQRKRTIESELAAELRPQLGRPFFRNELE